MRYFSWFLLALNLTIAVWCILVGSWGWLFSLFGIAVSIYMLVINARYRAETKARYKRWADEDAALRARIARYGHGKR